VITFHVPAMNSRHSVRVISARVCDVPGVRTVEADLARHSIQVTGSADPAEVLAAVTAAGYAVDPPRPRRVVHRSTTHRGQ
jgi:copper chaperone CopZ